MIISKAKGNALFSIALLAIVCMAGAIMLFVHLTKTADFWILKASIAFVLVTISLLLLSRIMKMNKKVSIWKEKISVVQRFPHISINIPLKSIKGWKMEEVVMKGENYKELLLLLDEKTLVKLSNREHTNFEQVLSFFEQKGKNKRIK